MQKDYEAACKAREEQGAEKIIKGIIGVGLGVGAIILTAGAAAPLVVTVAVCGAGGCSAAFGLSSGTEGVQDVCHGFTGNLSAHSFNPIRDTIFCGNQSAYDTWGNISMTISSFAIPAGKVLSSGATGLKAVKLYGTEIAKDFTIGYGSSKITGYASDMLHLNGVESLGLNLMLNMGLYKATSFAGSKLAGLKADVPQNSVISRNATKGLYDELNELKTPEERYDYLLDKAKTMDVSTKKNGAIFYAGRVETKNGIVTARQMAEKYADQLFEEKGVRKLTLERTPGGKWMDDLKLYEKLPSGKFRYEELGLTKSQTDNLWSTLSGRYAEGASGAVTAFAKNVPDVYKPKTVFYTTELKRLRFEDPELRIRNPNVTHINIR